MTANCAAVPSATVAASAATETVTVPGSAIAVVAAVASTVAVPAIVVALLSVTVSVSPWSSTPSSTVGIEIVPVFTPAPMVSVAGVAGAV